MKPKQLGNQGEQLAKQFLKNKGYRFLAQNFNSRYGEIDLIFSHKNVIVFVEVKTRTSSSHGRPEEAITSYKLQRLITTANYFLQTKNFTNKSSRLDLVAIDSSVNPPLITHIENISG